MVEDTDPNSGVRDVIKRSVAALFLILILYGSSQAVAAVTNLLVINLETK